jgi:hypothetical protein
MIPIGSVLYDGTDTLATLWPDGTWTVERLGRVDPAAGESLARYYNGEYGPPDGNPLVRSLYDLAERMKGIIQIDHVPPPEPGAVY